MGQVYTKPVRMAHPTVRCRARSVHQKLLRKVQAACAGFTYVEVLIATLLIVVTLLPAIQALYPAVAGAGYHSSRVEDHYRLAGRMEELLAEPFPDLDAAATAAGNETTPTTYSDTVTHPDGRQITLNEFLSRYDADNIDADNNTFTDTEDDLIWIRVEIAGTTTGLQSLLRVYD